MARLNYICENCGYTTGKWLGKCPSCGEWNTFTENDAPVEPKKAAAPKRPLAPASEAVKIKDVDAALNLCTPTGFAELDRVLGGGVFEGSMVLAGGEPGIGKSTLLLQVAASLANEGMTALYVSGEESARQIKLRAQRTGAVAESLYVAAQTEVSAILRHLEEVRPRVAIVDSIQTLYDANSASSPGSVSQIRECAAKLNGYAKSTGTVVFVIGHVTKEGTLAGPRVLEHMVDTVLYFEGSGVYKILRTVKNRFGSTNEIGVFEMTGTGLTEVSDFSAIFIEGMETGVPGSCVYCAMEGSRPVLVEVQALVSRSAFQNPRRMASGVELNRGMLICAVLEKRAGLALYDQDVYLNVAGGLKLSEPACDLAVALAIVSSFRQKPVNDWVAIGEMGLTGEIRSAQQLERRLLECAKMGFTRIIAPSSQLKSLSVPKGLTVVGARNIWDALDAAIT